MTRPTTVRLIGFVLLLGALPAGWRVWHDLDIGGENIDHVVASAKGVFVVEALIPTVRVSELDPGKTVDP